MRVLCHHKAQANNRWRGEGKLNYTGSKSFALFWDYVRQLLLFRGGKPVVHSPEDPFIPMLGAYLAAAGWLNLYTFNNWCALPQYHLSGSRYQPDNDRHISRGAISPSSSTSTGVLSSDSRIQRSAEYVNVQRHVPGYTHNDKWQCYIYSSFHRVVPTSPRLQQRNLETLYGQLHIYSTITVT